jgi:hypothetical protein
MFMVQAVGTAYQVAELAEQFAWIGAALRTSPQETRVAYARPSLTKTGMSGELHTTGFEPGIRAHVMFRLAFSMSSQEGEEPTKAECQCWHDMFRNPVVVLGYPIPRRPEPRTGLEIPINVMAALVGTRHANVFDGKLFIKGHNSMLVPREEREGFLLWHFLRAPKDERISYYYEVGQHLRGIEMSHIQSSRHVVGWCSSAELIAGKTLDTVVHSSPQLIGV